MTWLYIALNRTPNIDCYRVGAVPNLNPKPLATSAGRRRLEGAGQQVVMYSGCIGMMEKKMGTIIL